MQLSLNDLWYRWLQSQLPADVVSGDSQVSPGSNSGSNGAPIGGSVSVYGTLQGTESGTAGAAIVTIPAGSLPAGLYKVDIYTLAPEMTTGTTLDNVELRAGATSIVRVQHLNAAQNGINYNIKEPLSVWVELDGSTPLSLNFIANMVAGETQTWNATLVATRFREG